MQRTHVLTPECSTAEGTRNTTKRIVVPLVTGLMLWFVTSCMDIIPAEVAPVVHLNCSVMSAHGFRCRCFTVRAGPSAVSVAGALTRHRGSRSAYRPWRVGRWRSRVHRLPLHRSPRSYSAWSGRDDANVNDFE